MEVNRRKSIITIAIVIILLIILLLMCIGVIRYFENKPKNPIGTIYHSNLDEEDMMQYEYDKINQELNGIYAFAVSQNNIVAIKSKDESIKIIEINPEHSYDYLYNDKKLYLLEKDTGTISIIPLKTENGQYSVENVVNLNKMVDSFELCNHEIYFISENKLFKYNENAIEEIMSNITSKNFVIKNDVIYVVKDNNLISVDLDGNENIISSNVKNINYYCYYERNKLIYDSQIDEENNFKNIYNFYTNEIVNSINNNVYFVPYQSNSYVYITNDKKNIMFIDKNGNNSILLKSETDINNITLIKEGYVIVEKDDSIFTINLETKNIEENSNLKTLKNIRYIK